MTARERVMTTLTGEEPDKIPVVAFDWLRVGSQGGWVRRLVKRGLGIIRLVPAYRPAFLPPLVVNPHLEDVAYIQRHYVEKGVLKYRQTYETPVGSVTGVVRMNPIGDALLVCHAQEEYLVKEASDWHIMNYIFKRMLDEMVPNYQAFEREEDELGETGITWVGIERSPFQMAWIDLAGPERAFIDFKHQSKEIQEFIEIHNQIHRKAAKITAECKAGKIVDITENLTNMITPSMYRDYCMPLYEMHSKALEGTGKILGCHYDGLIGHLKKDIAQTPLNFIDSFTVPPVGDMSLTEAKSLWPDKVIFMNTPPHLALLDYEEVRKGYEAIAEEWGSKKSLWVEHSEEIPLDKVEMHLSAALDAFGYE